MRTTTIKYLEPSQQVRVTEARVFKINANRFNLCEDTTDKVTGYFARVTDATIERIIANPVKPGSHYEILGRATKELADYAEAIRSNDPKRAQHELFDLMATLGLLGSLSDHLIKID